MKVWELEEGKEYETKLKLARFKVVNNILYFYDRLNEGWKESTKDYNDVVRCDFTEYTPPTDWSKVEVDTKILVKHNESDDWVKRYFAEYKNSEIYAWAVGSTSFSHDYDYEDDIVSWKYAKLYTEEGET